MRARIGWAVLVPLLSGCGVVSELAAPECMQLHARLATEMNAIVEGHRGHCQQDADCIVFTPTVSCQSTCGWAIAASEETAARDDLARLDAAVCPLIPKTCDAAYSCIRPFPVCASGVCGESALMRRDPPSNPF